MDIFSKRDGPRVEDTRAKKHLQDNWGTITKLADAFSGGSYSAGKAKKAEPQAKGLIIMDQAPARKPDIPHPYLRISTNGRVVLADERTGRQLHFLGQLKRIDGVVRFTLATADNGFITPLEPELHDLIGDLGGKAVNRDYSEDNLADDLKKRLKLG